MGLYDRALNGRLRCSYPRPVTVPVYSDFLSIDNLLKDDDGVLLSGKGAAPSEYPREVVSRPHWDDSTGRGEADGFLFDNV